MQMLIARNKPRGGKTLSSLSNKISRRIKPLIIPHRMMKLMRPGLFSLGKKEIIRRRLNFMIPKVLSLFCHSGFYPDLSWDEFTNRSQKVLEAQDYPNEFLLGANSILEMKDWEKDNRELHKILTEARELFQIFSVTSGPLKHDAYLMVQKIKHFETKNKQI